MDVLKNKFSLPKSREELRKKLIEDRVNALSTRPGAKLSGLFPGLTDLDVKNQVLTPPPIASRREDEREEKMVRGEEPIKQAEDRDDEQAGKGAEEEEASAPEVKKKLPEFQIRKTALPASLLNMPDLAGNIEMMAQGGAAKILNPSELWTKAWEVLKTHPNPHTPDPWWDWLVKGRILGENDIALTNTIAAVDPEGVYARVNGSWVSLGHAYGRPLVVDNELYIFNINATTGSPIDKYLPSGSWSPMADLPERLPGETGTWDCCVHNGLFYIATERRVMVSPSWSVVDEQNYGWQRGLVSDGSSLYRLKNEYTNLRLIKIGTGEIASYSDTDISYAVLGYGENSKSLYACYVDEDVNWKVYRGNSLILSFTATARPDVMVASGPKYDYLAGGDYLYRLDGNTATQVYRGSVNLGNLAAFDEQICSGAAMAEFHSEWEGQPAGLADAAQKGTDTRFGM